MTNKQPMCRPALSIDDSKTLYKILNTYTVKPDDLHEAMLIQRLNKALEQFLVLNGNSTVQEIKQSLRQDAFEDYDWDAAFKALPDGPKPS
jgi:hypothetical protein